jgi:anionic cell wall polymer biosynthesis LytR-Cps2A-Psr (LCP) family protein
MDGAMALRYARERKVFADGDVERVKNQQDVIDAIIKKMRSSTELLSSYGDVLKAISANFKTSLSSDEIARLVKMQLNDMRGWTSESQNLTGFSDMSTVCYSLKGWNLYVMKQDPASIKKAKEKIDEFFGVTKKETKTEETDEIKSE